MTKCRNCGHDSHCGVPLVKDIRNIWEKHLGQIEVCKHCRCEKCTQPDWQEKIMCNNPECINPECTCDPCECTEENQCFCCEGTPNQCMVKQGSWCWYE